MSNAVIVTRHPAGEEFIRQHPKWRYVRCIASATLADVRGCEVAGNLPLNLASMAQTVWAIEFDGVPPRGTEYTLADMIAAGAKLVPYRVRAVVAVESPSVSPPLCLGTDAPRQ